MAKTLGLPFGPWAFVVIVFSLIRYGFHHGVRQIKETEPNYFQVVQPLFLGLMLAVYVGLGVRIYQGFLGENEITNVPEGDIFVYAFLVIALSMGLVFFPLIISAMVSFMFYIPYYISYKIGTLYGSNTRSLKHDEMRSFLKEYKAESSSGELTIGRKFDQST